RIAHVGRIRRLRPIRQQWQMIAYGRNSYTTDTNARHSRRNLVRLAVRLSAGCNFPEWLHRPVTRWRAGRTDPPASGDHHESSKAPRLSDPTRTDPPIRAHASRYQRQKPDWLTPPFPAGQRC